MHIFLFLLVVLSTMVTAEPHKTQQSSLLTDKKALEDLKKEIESLHLLLDQTKKTPVKNDDLKKRFTEALTKAHEELKNIDKAMETYNAQTQTDQMLNMPWQKFEQSISLRIAAFEHYLDELQKLYIASKEEDQTNFRPVISGQDSKRTNPVKRQRRRKTRQETLPLPTSSENSDGGPRVRYHYGSTTEPSKNPDEEPFLR